MSITTNVRRRFKREWTAPQFGDQPMLIDPAELEYLGTHRGRAWHSHKTFGELRERRGVLTDASILPATVLVVTSDVDGTRTYRAFDLFAPGSYTAAVDYVAQSARTPKPKRPLDALAGCFLGQRIPERIIAQPTRVESGPAVVHDTARMPATVYRAPEPAPVGAEQHLARLRSKGAEVRPTTDGTDLAVRSAGGLNSAGVAEYVRVGKPLFLPYLRDGKEPDCNYPWCSHKEPRPAVTVGEGGVLLCLEALAGEPAESAS